MEKKPPTKPSPTKPSPTKRSSCKNKGGSVLSDMSKLAVPFGLVAAKNSLERFIANRNNEIKKKQVKPDSKQKSSKKLKTKPKA